MISIILPSRKRFKYLKSSIDSLLTTCNNRDNIEILCFFDDDDKETITQFLDWDKSFHYKILISRRLGYRQMNVYNNLLSAIASGQWLFLWNDDARMISSHWDSLILNKYSNQFVFISPKNINNVSYTAERAMFPIFPKKWFDLTGRVSAHQHSDTYMSYIASKLNIFVHEPDISHEHGEIGSVGENRLNDEVTKEISYRSDFQFDEIEKDATIISQYLKT